MTNQHTTAIHLDTTDVNRGDYLLYSPDNHDFRWNEEYTEVTIVELSRGVEWYLPAYESGNDYDDGIDDDTYYELAEVDALVERLGG